MSLSDLVNRNFNLGLAKNTTTITYFNAYLSISNEVSPSVFSPIFIALLSLDILTTPKYPRPIHHAFIVRGHRSHHYRGSRDQAQKTNTYCQSLKPSSSVRIQVRTKSIRATCSSKINIHCKASVEKSYEADSCGCRGQSPWTQDG
jgi:hypothetical protein